MCIILQIFPQVSSVGDIICGACGEMVYLIDGDRQTDRQTEGALVLINFSYQELTWNSLHGPLMRLAVKLRAGSLDSWSQGFQATALKISTQRGDESKET